MGRTFKTREETYNFYDWMKEPELKKYLDKIPFKKISESLASNGLGENSICLCGKKEGCRCNTCRGEEK